MLLLTTPPRPRTACNKKVCVFIQEITLYEINPDIQGLVFPNGVLMTLVKLKTAIYSFLFYLKEKIEHVFKQKVLFQNKCTLIHLFFFL